MEERNISVLAYNLATILAEKLETVVSRGDANTRPRDYYDIFILTKLQRKNIEIENLRAALEATSRKRGSIDVIRNYRKIMHVVKDSSVMRQQWEKYKQDFSYVKDIEFDETCDVVVALLDEILL